MMLDMIKKTVTNIAALMLLGVILDLILPNDEIRKYARFVAGLLIMLSMLSPILSFIGKNNQLDYSAAIMRVEAVTAYSNAVVGSKGEAAETLLLRIAKEQAELAAKRFGMSEPQVETNIQAGKLWVRLYDKTASQNDDSAVSALSPQSYAEHAKEYIARALDISPEYVLIERRIGDD